MRLARREPSSRDRRDIHQLERRGEDLGCRGEVAALDEQLTQIRAVHRHERSRGDGAAQQRGGRLATVALRVHGEPEEVQRVGVLRLTRQNVAVERDRVGNPARRPRLLRRDAPLNRPRDGRGSGRCGGGGTPARGDFVDVEAQCVEHACLHGAPSERGGARNVAR